MRKNLNPTCALALAVAILTTLPAPAGAADAADHPAAKIVVTYLNHALARDWDTITSLIEKRSLAGVHRGFIGQLKSAPTIDDERQMLRSLGKEDVREVEAMDPADFYAAYHKSLQERFELTDEKIKAIRASIKVNVLSVGQDGDDLVHVLVRTEHQDGKNRVRNLELISLVKAGDKWLVSLDKQRPEVVPIEE